MASAMRLLVEVWHVVLSTTRGVTIWLFQREAGLFIAPTSLRRFDGVCVAMGVFWDTSEQL